MPQNFDDLVTELRADFDISSANAEELAEKIVAAAYERFELYLAEEMDELMSRVL